MDDTSSTNREADSAESLSEYAYDWTLLERLAREEVEVCLASLPEEIRAAAEAVPCLLRRWHPAAEEGDCSFADYLGEYLDHGDDERLTREGVIVLYLGGIALYCEDEELCFEDEVRTTYLHELGHHLGWDEDEVERRGL